jgi:hypothetical protein
MGGNGGRFVLTVAVPLLLASPALARPVERHVDAAFAATLCPGSAADRRVAAWQAGVYDAQVEGRFLEPVAGRPVTSADAARKARTLADAKRYGSYASGTCANGAAWALAFPSPTGLAKADAKGRLRLPAALDDACKSVRADFAAAASGQTKALSIAGNAVSVAGLGDGTLAVTCQPRAPRWQGPVLWYLAPVGAGPAKEPPEADALAAAAPVPSTLASWINRVRRSEGLAALESAPELDAFAKDLAADGSLVHDRQQLGKVADQLKARELRFLGEDRVKGPDARAMAWLLWNSPRHRALLLGKDATTLGLGLRAVGGEQLAVLVTAARAPLVTAGGRAPSRTPRR